MPCLTLLGFIGPYLEEATDLVGYVLVFVFAMVPGIEPFIVIPVAIGLGLDPVLTGIAAFLGSVTAVGVIVVAYCRLIVVWRRFRGRTERKETRRFRWAKRVWDRYGLAGLAFIGPILAGIHLTALFAAISSSNSRLTMGWLTIGLAVWTVGLVLATLGGLSLLGVS